MDKQSIICCWAYDPPSPSPNCKEQSPSSGANRRSYNLVITRTIKKKSWDHQINPVLCHMNLTQIITTYSFIIIIHFNIILLSSPPP